MNPFNPRGCDPQESNNIVKPLMVRARHLPQGQKPKRKRILLENNIRLILITSIKLNKTTTVEI